MNNKYLFKLWLTSGILCPIIMLIFLSLLPNYHIPDMIGLLLVIYIFPCTLLLSIVNIAALAVTLSITSRNLTTEKNTKFILSGVSILVSYITMLLAYYTHTFEILEDGVDYVLLGSYILAINIAMFFFRLTDRDTATIVSN